MSATTATTATVANNLRVILELAADLSEQARHAGADRDLPGGAALIQLGPVASPETWANRLDGAERRALADPANSPWPEVVELDDETTALQLLLFWSEAWREEVGYPLEGRRPTLTSEARILRTPEFLTHAWQTEPHFDVYAADVSRARAILEDVLNAGSRPTARGVACMYDGCGGVRVQRTTVPCRMPDGSKGWRMTDWYCPRCHRRWSEDEYTRSVYAMIERQHWAEIADDTWVTYSRAARTVGRPEGTIRSWVARGEIASVCLIDQTRRAWTFVLKEDVLDRDLLTRTRAETTRRGRLTGS